MKNRKKNTIATITTLSLLFTGCSIKPEKQPIPEYVQIQTEDSEMQTSEPINQAPEMVEEPKEIESFSYFKEAKQEIIEYIESDDFAKIKEKGKSYITTGIDFIFFDQPINDIYFNDLTEEVKKEIIEDLHSLDEAIMAYYPDYKDSLQQKYQIAASFMSEKYLDILDRIKEYLGEEKYNTIGDKKDQAIEEIIEQKEKVLEYIKKNYQDWKNE